MPSECTCKNKHTIVQKNILIQWYQTQIPHTNLFWDFLCALHCMHLHYNTDTRLQTLFLHPTFFVLNLLTVKKTVNEAEGRAKNKHKQHKEYVGHNFKWFLLPQNQANTQNYTTTILHSDHREIYSISQQPLHFECVWCCQLYDLKEESKGFYFLSFNFL